MYDLLDRPVCDLPTFEARILAATRRWVHALTLAGTAPADEDDGAFGAAMAALDRGSSETLVIQRPCHATVEETEAVILSIWRLVRGDRYAAAQAAATALTDPANGRAMVAAMGRVAAAQG